MIFHKGLSCTRQHRLVESVKTRFGKDRRYSMADAKKQTNKYKRILLKLSGEAMMGDGDSVINSEFLEYVAKEVSEAIERGVQVAIVPGGGNIVRGATLSEQTGIERANADYMGMLATIINGLALQAVLEKHGLETRILSAIMMREVAEPFIRRRAIRHMEKGRVVILAAGTGLPYVTTDSGAALRGLELYCDAVLKATQVDGVYTDDPKKNLDATKIDVVDFEEALMNPKINVMDSAALALCRDNNVDIIVFDLHKPGNLNRILDGELIGTTVTKVS
jgi:uridylate kinase